MAVVLLYIGVFDRCSTIGGCGRCTFISGYGMGVLL